MKPLIQFLVANYNSIDHIHILIKSLRTYHPGVSYQLLIADQGSTDGSKEYLQSLEEVTLWELESRPKNTDYNDLQYSLINKYNLWPYLHPFFQKRTIQTDYRQFHGSAINFLVSKVDSPFFATLDTDMEFLGPLWFQTFLTEILNGYAAVGSLQEPIHFNINTFHAFTCMRHHPCLTFYNTNKINDINLKFDTDPWFELRMPMIHKCIVEGTKEFWQLGDMGYQVYLKIWDKVKNLSEEEFYGSVRHFQGATVKKDTKNPLLEDWLKSISHLKELYKYGKDTYAYTKLNNGALRYCSAYWSGRNPDLPKQPKIPIIVVD